MRETKFRLRTSTQNNALHLGFELLANHLNDSGLTMRKVLKPSVEIEWTKDSIKKYLWKPVMRAMRGKKSTTELNKVGDITEIWDTIFRFLGEKHQVEYLEFPHTPEKEKAPLR